MVRFVRTFAVLAMLLGQVVAGTQAFALGDCTEMTPGQDAADAQHAMHAGQGELHGHADHREAERTANDPDSVNAASCCHCVSSLHCGQLTAFSAELASAGDPVPNRSMYLTAPRPQPMLAHRREVDRPPA